MKWLLLILVSINVILVIIQFKDRNDVNVEKVFSRASGTQDIRLLKEVVESMPDRCFVIGAIPDLFVLDKLEQFLKKADVAFDIINKEEELAPNYWVYVVDPLSEELTGILTAMQIESYVVASGELKGRLSVGLFANIDLAQDMINALKKENIKAELIEKKKTKKTQWISFRADQVSDKEHLMKGLNALEINVDQIKEFFCKSIASEK